MLKKSLVIFSLVLLPMGLFSDQASIEVQDLKTELNKLHSEITKINNNSKKVRKISEEYYKIALAHKKVVVSYSKQQASCANLRVTYKKQKEAEQLASATIKLQDKRLLKCYQNLEMITYNFSAMSRDFKKLEKSIKTLNKMSAVEIASLESLEDQLNTVQDLIKLKQSLATTNVNKLQKRIDNWN